MFAELFQLFIKAEFDQELCPWRICQSLTFPRPIVPLPTLLRIPTARCLCMSYNSPSPGLAVSAIYTADRTSASQRPVFGNQPTKLWLWYRRESKLRLRYFSNTKRNIYFNRKISCVGIWLIYICGQPVVIWLFLLALCGHVVVLTPAVPASFQF